MPEGVTSIDDNTFRACRQLVSISIPNSLTSIGLQSFYDCQSIVSINIPPSVTHIDAFAFGGCMSLSTFNIHPSTQICRDAFGYSLTVVNKFANAQNLSTVEYVRLQFRINLRVAVHMCTNSKIAHELNVVQPQLDNGRVIADGELDGVLAKTLLIDDVWRGAIEFL